MNSRKPLVLSETFRHFNSLMWQIPSWGIAIATGVVLVANEIGKKPSSDWQIPTRYVQALVLLFGFVLLVPLTILHHRFRAYEADSVPEGSLPTSPFDQAPHAERYLQLALCMTTAGLLALAAMQIFPSVKIAITLATVMSGGIAWWILSKLHKSVVENINKARGEVEKKVANTPQGTYREKEGTMPVDVRDLYQQAFETLRYASDFRAKIIQGWLKLYTVFAAIFIWVSKNYPDLTWAVGLAAAVMTLMMWLADVRNRPAIRRAKDIGKHIEDDCISAIPEERRFFSGPVQRISHSRLIDMFAIVSLVMCIGAAFLN